MASFKNGTNKIFCLLFLSMQIGSSFRYMPQDKLNMKTSYSSAIPCHQDWAFFPHTNDSALTTSVLIDDSTRENGKFRPLHLPSCD